jgi:hypothetical protein
MLCSRQRLVLKFVKCPVAAGKNAGRDRQGIVSFLRAFSTGRRISCPFASVKMVACSFASGGSSDMMHNFFSIHKIIIYINKKYKKAIKAW